MNEALLWLFLVQPVVDNQLLIEMKEKEKTCAHRMYTPSSCKKNKKAKIKVYQKTIYYPTQPTATNHAKRVYS